ncbi:MAG: hypothetical protein ACRC5H_08450 [Treponemataceae bacterium]
MSICPNKELLSAYCDEEVPVVWKEKITEHIKTCNRCNATVQKLMILQKNIREYSHKNNFSANELETSFENLQLHLRYQQNTSLQEKKRMQFTIMHTFVAALFVCTVLTPVLFGWVAKEKHNLPQNSNDLYLTSENSVQKIDLIKSVGIVFLGKKDFQAFIDQYSIENYGVISIDNTNPFSLNFDDDFLSISLPKITDIHLDKKDVYYTPSGSYK